jgi:peptide/nickel transport system substrate-binding protein
MAAFSRTWRRWSRIGLLVGIATVVPLVQAQATTLRAVLNSGLRALDPIVNTSVVTNVHAMMIYDQLLGQDAKGEIHPQMASWATSPDGKTYRFTLREGLKFHDGSPVTSEDCIASIKRWGQVDTMGQVLMRMLAGMQAIDDRQFEISLTQANDLILEALAKTGSRPAVIMPRRLAETPPSQAVAENVGSGPFRMATPEFRPGIRAVYVRNRDYVSRPEPLDGSAGGKQALVERVEFVAMPDQMTALNALINGEVDFLESVPYDLLPLLKGNRAVKLDVLNKEGNWTMFRMNFLHPPFDNPLLRQAAMLSVRQQDILDALVGEPKYYRTCPAVFGCGLPYESRYGSDFVVSGNPAKAKELLKEAGYQGAPVVILQPSDNPFASSQPLVIAQALRRTGFNVQVQTMDWQSLTARRANDGPPASGGWSIFVTFSAIGDQSDPIRSLFVAAAGKKSWFGWPDVPEIEELRTKFAFASDKTERRSIAERINRLAIDEGLIAPLGQYVYPSAYSDKLSDVPAYPRPVFWNIRKAN